MQTNNIQLNLLHSHQIHKEILLNENAVLTDAMLFNGLQSRTHISPPSDAEIGSKYIVPINAENEWQNMDNKLAVKLEDRWIFITPKEGMMFWVISENKLIVLSQGLWKELLSP